MDSKGIAEAIKNCYWINEIYGFSVCTNECLPCIEVIKSGKCQMPIELFNKEKEKTMEDLISRQAAIDFVKSIPYIKKHQNMGELIKEWLEQIPGVQPVQKTGRWIDDNCSECGQYVYHGDANNYCPNCGAKMESDGEKTK